MLTLSSGREIQNHYFDINLADIWRHIIVVCWLVPSRVSVSCAWWDSLKPLFGFWVICGSMMHVMGLSWSWERRHSCGCHFVISEKLKSDSWRRIKIYPIVPKMAGEVRRAGLYQKREHMQSHSQEEQYSKGNSPRDSMEADGGWDWERGERSPVHPNRD